MPICIYVSVYIRITYTHISTNLRPKLHPSGYLTLKAAFCRDLYVDVLGLWASGKARLYKAELMNLDQAVQELGPFSTRRRTINNNKKAKQLRGIKQNIMTA